MENHSGNLVRIVISISLLLFLLAGCGGISFISSSKKQDHYSKEFKEHKAEVRKLYQRGDVKKAIAKLNSLNDQTLNPVEKAAKKNLLGVIYFSTKNYEQAIFHFNLGLETSEQDEDLTSKIYLNLGSSYFALGYLEKSYTTLKGLKNPSFGDRESRKYYKLRYNLARELGDANDAVLSLAKYLKSKKSFNEVKLDSLFGKMKSQFFSLSDGDRLRMVEGLYSDAPIISGYLGYLEAEKLFYSGRKDDSRDLLDWIGEKFEEYPEIKKLAENFNFRIENFAKMDKYSIGVILPLSGKKAYYGERALNGLDSAFRRIKDNQYKLHIKDSKGSGIVGSSNVKELVEKKMVSVIIGGLFPSEAEREYLEAKKYGAFFISLSPVYLPKEEKNHLLLEIPGSVESQVEQLFSTENLNQFGKRVAIIYPRGMQGEAYLEEFWKTANETGAEVVGVTSFDSSNTDLRKPVRNLLGLKNPRARMEEFELLEEVHALEKRNSIRRIQTLKPKIDFDWIFIPSLPEKALQLIPSFSYYDAFGLKIIGNNTWRSKKLSNESYKLGKLFFVDDFTESLDENFVREFTSSYGVRPRLVEVRTFDAMDMAISLLSGQSVSERGAFDSYILSQSELKGLSGNWFLKNGLWKKKMDLFVLEKGKIRNHREESL